MTYIPLFFVWNSSDFCWKNAKILSVYHASECDSRLGYSDYSFLAVFLLKNALIFEWHAAFFDSRCLLASSGPLPPDAASSFHKRIFSTSLALRCVFFFAFPIHKTFDRHLSSWFVPLGHFIWLSLRSSIAWSISMLNKLYLIFKLRSLIVSWFLGLMSSKNRWNGPLLFLPQGSFHLFGMEGIVVVICKYLLLVVHTDECSQ